jgi:hypothetical protein
MRNNKTEITIVVVVFIVIGLVSFSTQRFVSGVPLPQAEQQRIHNLAVLCTEAVSENYYYGNFTTVTDESVLAECDDLFVDLKNQCDVIGLVMEQCSDPAYDKYIEDRGLSGRIEPQKSNSAALSPFSPNLENNDDGNESTDDENNDGDEGN